MRSTTEIYKHLAEWYMGTSSVWGHFFEFYKQSPNHVRAALRKALPAVCRVYVEFDAVPDKESFFKKQGIELPPLSSAPPANTVKNPKSKQAQTGSTRSNGV
jgi:hypothetical protein